MAKNLIIYHRDCLDGFAAAFAAWKVFSGNAEYVGGSYGYLPKIEPGQDVYILDITYPKSLIENLQQTCSSVKVIDHGFCGDFTESSGAVLAWQYFYRDLKVPEIFKYIEDYDTRQFKMGDTGALIYYLKTLQFEFAEWNAVVDFFETMAGRIKIIEQGGAISRYARVLAGQIAARAETHLIFGLDIEVVESPILMDEVAEVLYTRKPPISIVWYLENGFKKVVLRKNPESNIELSHIAEKFGGRGSRDFAEFKVPADQKLPWE